MAKLSLGLTPSPYSLSSYKWPHIHRATLENVEATFRSLCGSSKHHRQQADACCSFVPSRGGNTSCFWHLLQYRWWLRNSHAKVRLLFFPQEKPGLWDLQVSYHNSDVGRNCRPVSNQAPKIGSQLWVCWHKLRAKVHSHSKLYIKMAQANSSLWWPVAGCPTRIGQIHWS